MESGSKNNGNQKPFEKMIIMKYDCVGIGLIKMTVGVRRRTHEKVSIVLLFDLRMRRGCLPIGGARGEGWSL